MNLKIWLLGLIAVLSVSAVSAQSFIVSQIDVDVTYPAPYDRFSNTRDDSDEGLIDGQSIEADIYPGSQVEFSMDIENVIDEDIDGIFATITVEDLNDGDDVEIETQEIDLDEGDEGEIRAIISVPTKVEDITYDVVIEVEGDVNGTIVTEEINLIMKVKKDNIDLKVTTYSVTPTLISCDRTIEMYGVMTNVASNEASNAAFEIRSEPLGVTIKRTDITLSDDPFDEESEFVLRSPFTISNTVQPGTYNVEFIAWFNNQLPIDRRNATVVVQSCATNPQTPQPQSQQPVQSEQPQQQTQNATTQAQTTTTTTQQTSTQTETNTPTSKPTITTSTEQPFISSTLFKALVIGLNAIILLGLIIIGAMLVARKKSKAVERYRR